MSSLVGSKSLTRADIDPVITKMQDHLIAKNVAADVAAKLCESVAHKLEGKVMGTFQVHFKTYLFMKTIVKIIPGIFESNL